MENTEFPENNYPFSEITDKIIKCAIEVHKTLGTGFLESIYENQILSYLKATKKRIGLLINFAKTKIDIKRVIL